jgi:hypothetical protein
MLIRDNKFDEFTLLDNISKINMTRALARVSFHVWIKIKHVRPPKPRNELLLHRLNSIDLCAIESPPHTTGVCKFRAHKRNIKGLKSIRVPNLTRQPLHKPQHRIAKVFPTVTSIYPVKDILLSIKDDTTQHLRKFNRMTQSLERDRFAFSDVQF